MKSNQQTVFSLRMPDSLKRWFEEEAAKNRRSINTEILIRLERAFEDETGKQVKYK